MTRTKSKRTKSQLEKIFEQQLKDEPEMIPFEDEVYFLDNRMFRFDFANRQYKIAVELDGGTFSKGKSGHTSGKGIAQDMEKYNLATLLGWRVFRFDAPAVKEGRAIGFLDRAVKALLNGEVME
jgi:very-short-patch-repair endonuclease